MPSTDQYVTLRLSRELFEADQGGILLDCNVILVPKCIYGHIKLVGRFPIRSIV